MDFCEQQSFLWSRIALLAQWSLHLPASGAGREANVLLDVGVLSSMPKRTSICELKTACLSQGRTITTAWMNRKSSAAKTAVELERAS